MQVPERFWGMNGWQTTISFKLCAVWVGRGLVTLHRVPLRLGGKAGGGGTIADPTAKARRITSGGRSAKPQSLNTIR